jgi:putative heme iron utilization protein
MVPFVLTDDAARIVIHVSRLAAHTGNLMRDPRVSLLVMQAEETGILPQGLPRVTLQGRAEVVARPAPGYRELQADYLRRFPDSADLFTFPDFHLVAIRVESARFVAGFAQAQTLTSEAFRRVLGRPAS